MNSILRLDKKEVVEQQSYKLLMNHVNINHYIKQRHQKEHTFHLFLQLYSRFIYSMQNTLFVRLIEYIEIMILL